MNTAPWLLPFWLLGAPMVLALIDLMRTRSSVSRMTTPRA